MFFDKPVWQLDLAQAALLAGLPQAPSDYNPFLRPRPGARAPHEVLQAMVQLALHHPGAGRAPPSASRSRSSTNNAYHLRRQPYVFDYVQQQLISKFGLEDRRRTAA